MFMVRKALNDKLWREKIRLLTLSFTALKGDHYTFYRNSWHMEREREKRKVIITLFICHISGGANYVENEF